MGDRFEPGLIMMHQRIVGTLFFVVAVLVTGLPPLSGFVGKFMILQAALSHTALPWIMVIVLITSLFTIIALARSGSLLFYRAQAPQASHAAMDTHVQPSIVPDINGLVIATCLLALCAVIMIWAGAIIEFVQATANQLLQPDDYIQSVLGIEK